MRLRDKLLGTVCRVICANLRVPIGEYRVASNGLGRATREWAAGCQGCLPGTMYRAPTKKRQRRADWAARCQECLPGVRPEILADCAPTKPLSLVAISFPRRGSMVPRLTLAPMQGKFVKRHLWTFVAARGIGAPESRERLPWCARFSFPRGRRRTGSRFRTGMTRSTRACVAAGARGLDKEAR
jgi:hypothetical protein